MNRQTKINRVTFICSLYKDRDFGRQGGREREKEREADRQKDRQGERQTDRDRAFVSARRSLIFIRSLYLLRFLLSGACRRHINSNRRRSTRVSIRLMEMHWRGPTPDGKAGLLYLRLLVLALVTVATAGSASELPVGRLTSFSGGSGTGSSSSDFGESGKISCE